MRLELDTLTTSLQNAPPLLLYQLFASLLVLGTALNALSDWFALRRPPRTRLAELAQEPGQEPAHEPAQPSRIWPSVSVLVPARDEAETLQRCVGSLIAQEYPGDVEILILDDGSSDHTGFIAGGLAAGSRRVRALTGGDLLPGWKGKPNALRQLAAAARGDLLLFTDADCILLRGGLEAAVRFRESVQADCLSLMPQVECRSFWEHVIEPMLPFLVFTAVPVGCIPATRSPVFSAAYGGFLLLPRTVYEDVGGHEAVKAELADDVKFARHLKRRGYRLAYADGTRLYRVRLYRSLREIRDGLAKVFFAAMGQRLGVLALWTLFQLITQIAPFAFVIAALAERVLTPVLFWIPLSHCLAAVTIRTALAIRFRQALWSPLLHPLAAVMTIGIALDSAYRHCSGKGYVWKGRAYSA